jgi:hypothetical protein
MENKKSVERREHKRFRVPIGSFVWVGLDGTILGQIIDVSMGGLAFHYIGKESSNGSHLDMFLTEHDLSLHEVPFITVSKVLGRIIVKGAQPRSIAIRRCGVQFGDLTQSQTSQLEYLIQNCTVGEV